MKPVGPQSSEPPPSGAAAEPDVAELIQRYEDDGTLLVELGELFLRQNPLMLAQIGEAIRSGDASRLEHAAHSLKGSLLNLCAPQTAQCAGRLEAMGAKRQLAGAEEALAALAERMAPMVQRLRQLVIERGGNPEMAADDFEPR